MDTTKEYHISNSHEKIPDLSENHLDFTQSENHLDSTQSENHLDSTQSENHLDSTQSENHLDSTQSENTECGIMGFRPKFLNRFRNMLTFSIISGFVGIMASVQTYFGSQIPHLEKQFGLNSAESGLIVAWSRIGYLIFNLFGSSTAQLIHIPLVLFWFMVIYSIAGLCLTIPYFAMSSEGILSTSKSTSADNFTLQSSTKSKSNEFFFCDLTTSNITDAVGIGCDVNVPEVSDAGSDVQQYKTMASVIFSLCLLVMGIVYASRFPYTTVFVDDNVNKLKTGFYIGFLYGIGIFGPALAFTIGGATSKIYVTLEEVDFTLQDPRWIGAWWLGFIIFSAGTLVTALPMLCFPRRFKNKTDPVETSINKQPKPVYYSRKERIKERLLSYWRVLTTPIYVSLIFINCIIGFPWIGYWSFISKYITTQFSTPLWKGNMILAVSNIVSMCAGCFGGGIISRKVKMTPRNCMMVNVIFTFMSVIIFGFGFITGCDQPVILGPDSTGGPDMNSTSPCILDCSCDVNEFFPICGSDGNNYYSPCYAGCPSTSQKNRAFSNCTCIPDGMATSGLCDSDCPNLYPWAVINFLSFFTDALTWMPTITSWIRSVEDRDKSTAIGLQSIIGTLLAFMPSPIAFGKIIDTSCLIWESRCGSKGSCQFYDIVDMRIKLHAVTLGMKLVGTLALVYVLWKVWNVESWEKFQEKRKSKRKKGKKLEGLT